MTKVGILLQKYAHRSPNFDTGGYTKASKRAILIVCFYNGEIWGEDLASK